MRSSLEDIAVCNVRPWHWSRFNRFWIIGQWTCSAQISLIIIIANNWIHFWVINCGKRRINHQTGRKKLFNSKKREKKKRKRERGRKVQLNFCSEKKLFALCCRHRHHLWCFSMSENDVEFESNLEIGWKYLCVCWNVRRKMVNSSHYEKCEGRCRTNKTNKNSQISIIIATTKCEWWAICECLMNVNLPGMPPKIYMILPL